MVTTKHFININPAAEADIPKINAILKSDPDYVAGLEITNSEIINPETMGNKLVKFYYYHPENITPDQKTKAKLLVDKVISEFMVLRENAR